MENKEREPLRVKFKDWEPVIIPIEDIKLRHYYFALEQSYTSYVFIWIYVTEIIDNKIIGYGTKKTTVDRATVYDPVRWSEIIKIEIDYNSEVLYGFDFLRNEALEIAIEQNLKQASELYEKYVKLEKENRELFLENTRIEQLVSEVERLKNKLGYHKPDNLLSLGAFEGDYYEDIKDFIIKEFKNDDLEESIAKAEIESKLSDKEILIAFLNGDCCWETTFFLLRDNEGQLYEVHAWHCSCMGFEGQFDLEPTDIKALKFRIENGEGLNSDIKGDDKKKVEEYINNL